MILVVVVVATMICMLGRGAVGMTARRRFIQRRLLVNMAAAPADPVVVSGGSKKVKKARQPGRENIGRRKAVLTSSKFPRYEIVEEAVSGLPTKELFCVLGIETSCDDTAAAVVRSDGVIMGESVASQHEIHASYGGIVPGLAQQAHVDAIDRVVEEALSRAGLASPAELDAIGCTTGPGLEICLRVGANKARGLALEHGLPFVRAHHLEAHCMAARLPLNEADTPIIEFPFVALLVSGGHCMLLWCSALGDFEVLGGTLDDALGEAYDKAARMLGLAAPVGGGPALEAAAALGNATAVRLPVPLRQGKAHRKSMDFSYSGLKNGLRGAIAAARERLLFEDEGQALPVNEINDLAASFQNVAITHLEDRLKNMMDTQGDRLLLNGSQTPTLALVGGVAANKEIRRRLTNLCDDKGWRLAVPPPRLCTDNGVMVAWAAIEKLKLSRSDDPENDNVYARWPFREYIPPPEPEPEEAELATSP